MRSGTIVERMVGDPRQREGYSDYWIEGLISVPVTGIRKAPGLF